MGIGKILDLKKNFNKNFGSEIFFGSNTIYGLKILGPKKISGLEKNFGFKKICLKKNQDQKMFGPEIFFEKNCGSKKILI